MAISSYYPTETSNHECKWKSQIWVNIIQQHYKNLLWIEEHRERTRGAAEKEELNM